MPLSALLLPILAAAVQAPAQSEEPIVVKGRSGPPFISPMGEPFRALAPGEDTLANWFRQADRNHDGFLTPDEMRADAERFFARLDTNQDGEIEPEELVQYEWELAPEIQVNSRLRRPRAVAGANAQPSSKVRRRVSEAADDGVYVGSGEGLQGGARYALLNIPEPVAAADANFDRAITLDEFRQAAIARFQLLDSRREGRLALQELRALLPTPSPGTKPKRRRGEPDARYGLPLPPGD